MKNVYKLFFLLTISISFFEGFAQTNEIEPSLENTIGRKIHIGAAIKESHLDWRGLMSREIVQREFNSITPENLLKWDHVHPLLSDYEFCASDEFVQFGEAHDMFVVGHVLVWHQQTPKWVFEDSDGKERSRESLTQILSEHIRTVVSRYSGKIHGWDVVNEALNDDGSLRESKWLEILGEDYVKLAFELAGEADSDAELYYNDYNLWKAEKREGAVRLVRSLLNNGIEVDGIGMQGHWSLNFPSVSEIKASIDAFIALGVKVHITELDIDVLPSAWDNVGADISANFELNERLNPYVEGLPEEVEQAQAERYAELFELFLSYPDDVVRVTLWGVHDGDSWRNNWPVQGRTAYPLLFDREGTPKEAYHAILSVVREDQP